MLYELRIYEALPGKLPRLQQRFSEDALPLFTQHGIRQIGFWTTYIGPSLNTLTYLLAWEDLAERQTRWDAFQSDPTWLAAKERSERDGPLLARVESQILSPTAYSALR